MWLYLGIGIGIGIGVDGALGGDLLLFTECVSQLIGR